MNAAYTARIKNLWQEYLKVSRKETSHRNELMCVQWLRGVAVLMVLLVHIEDIIRLIAPFHDIYTPWNYVGYSGPDLFFVISGFIMSYVTFAMPFEPKRWLINRLIRIYPVYLAFTGLLCTLWIINPSITMGSGVETWGAVLRSFLIIPQAELPLLFVGWTLEHEVVFYAIVFCVALVATPRALLLVVGVLSVLAALRWIFRDTYEWLNFWDYHLLSLFMFQFFIGACVFQYREKLRLWGGKWPIVAGLALCLIASMTVDSGYINHENLPRVLMFGVAYGLILLGLINKEKQERENNIPPPEHRPFLVRLGDASYSVYLFHVFLLAVCGKALYFLGIEGWVVLVVMALVGGISLWGGICIYNFFEKPMLHFMKKGFMPRPAPTPPAVAPTKAAV